MDDKRIEDLLRNTLRTTPPEEMRHRTLRLARQELSKRQTKPQILGMSRWQLACLAVGVAVVIFTNNAENRREDRIASMVGVDSHSISTPANRTYFYCMTQDINGLLASAQVDSHPQRSSKEENPL